MRSAVTVLGGPVLAAVLIGAPAAAQPFLSLPNPNPTSFGAHGFAVIRLGGAVAVGAPGDLVGGDTGAVHLFDPVSRVLIRTIVNPAGDYNRFGHALADVGGMLLVGAPGATFPATAGAAYLFDPADGSLLQTFVDPAPSPTDFFGRSVAAAGGNALIGAPGNDTGASISGLAYLFDAGDGSLLRTFPNPSPNDFDEFGDAVAGFGGDVLIGAGGEDTPGTDDGAVYRFDAGTGALLHTYLNPNPGGGCLDGEHFGAAIVPTGGDILIGTPCEDMPGTEDGAVYLFSAGGALLRTFLNPNGSSSSFGGFFGRAIAVAGGTVFIGAPNDYPFGGIAPSAGAVIEFDVGTGAVLRSLRNPTPQHLDEFGWAVATVGGNVVIGAPTDDPLDAGGAAYIFGTTDCAGEPSGTLCPDDGSLCSFDTCDGAGTCTHTFAPQAACKATVAAGKAKLVLKDNPTRPRDKLAWKWKGEPTAKVEFGHATGFPAADYTLCLYDTTAGVPSLEFSASALSTDVCGSGSCWIELRRGWKYINRGGSPGGLTKIVLKENATPGRSKAVVKGKGPALTLPSPLAVDQDPSVVAQLVNSAGACWEATYSSALRNTPTKFKAKSD